MIAALLVQFSCLSFAVAEAAEIDEEALQLLKALPTDSRGVAQEKVRTLMERGPECIACLVDVLSGEDAELRVKAQHALSGMAFYSARPGGEKDRALFVRAALGKLDSDTSDQVKGFLILQLQVCGDKTAVPALGEYLLHDGLYDKAAMAIETIGGEQAEAALIDAVPRAKGKQLLTILRALGSLRCEKAAPVLHGYLESEDRDLSRMAAFALANIPHGPSATALLKMSLSASRYEEAVGGAACLLLARRLREEGREKEAVAIYTILWSRPVTVSTRQLRADVLRALCETEQQSALARVLEAMQDEDYQMRAVAAELASSLPGEGVTTRLVEEMHKARPDVRKLMVEALGKRGDEAALPALRAAMSDADEQVAVAAVHAYGCVAGAAATDELIGALASERQSVRASARQELLEIPDRRTTEAFARALGDAPPVARIELLGMLTARRAVQHGEEVQSQLACEDVAVRVGALKALGALGDQKHLAAAVKSLVAAEGDEESKAAGDAVVALAGRTADEGVKIAPLREGVGTGTPRQRIAVIRLLNRIGGNAALQILRDGLRDADAGVAEAATRTLAKWSDDSAAGDLIAIAERTDNMTNHVLALRGYIRLAGQKGARRRSATLGMYRRAMAVAKRPDEKKQVLSGLADVPKLGVLKTVVRCLDDEALRGEAVQATLRLCEAMSGEYPRHTRAALAKVLSVSDDGNVRRQVEGILDAGVAVGKPVKASRTDHGHAPERVVDGKFESEHVHWDGGPAPQWLQIDLEKPTKMRAVHVYTYWDGKRSYQYTVDASLDGKEWKRVADMSRNKKPSTGEGFLHEFDPCAARYVRVNMLKNTANPSVHLVEVRVLGVGRPEGFTEHEKFLQEWLRQPDEPRKVELFVNDLSAWDSLPEGWAFADGMLRITGQGPYMWTKEQFDDFVLDLEFKLEKGANSGVFIRAASKSDPVGRGMEIQLYDTYELKEMKRNSCGALYDIVVPSRNTLKKPGEWNRMIITCDDNIIEVELNGERIVHVDLDLCTEAGKNPDGSQNKFKTAYKDMPRVGYVSLQNYGGDHVYFRKMILTPIE